jgi:hypothetical protein
LSIFSLLAVPVTPSRPSTSAGVSNRFDSAAWAIGGFEDVVDVVVVVPVVDAAGPLPLPPPHAAIDIATAATATPAINRRMHLSPFRAPWSTEHSLGPLRLQQIIAAVGFGRGAKSGEALDELHRDVSDLFPPVVDD